MAVINHAKREINAKIVYFGAPGCGKGELFNFIHQRIKPGLCGPLKTMPAGSDTLLFFDYIPYEHSSLDGYRIRFHLYTLIGPVTNPGTWKMTLKGVDGLAFVTATEAAGADTATESFRVLRSMLGGYGKDLRSLPRLWLSFGNGNELLGATEFGACFDGKQVACSFSTGEGVLQSLAQLSQSVLQQLRQEYEPSDGAAVTPSAVVDRCIDEGMSSGEAPQKMFETITLPEVKLTLSGNSVVQVPLVIQDGDSLKRCMLSLALQIEPV